MVVFNGVNLKKIKIKIFKPKFLLQFEMELSSELKLE